MRKSQKIQKLRLLVLEIGGKITYLIRRAIKICYKEYQSPQDTEGTHSNFYIFPAKMNAEAIPVEILVMIFRNLKGTEAAVCRAVCRRWRDVIDSFTDDVWKYFCTRDFWNPTSAKAVSNLSYRDLYKSLALWSKVEKAEERCPTKPVENVFWFKVLNNNTVGVIKCDFLSGSVRTGLLNNVIEYYNIQTMTLISRKSYDFSILRYHENEKLIAIIDMELRLHVIVKSNNKQFVVGDQNHYNNFTLFDTEVYFKNAGDMMCVSRLKVVDGEETVETEEIEDLEEHVIAFARASDDGLNILTDEGNIYCYRNQDFEHYTQIDQWTDNIIYELWDYGFHWSDLNIHRWLLTYFSEEEQQITKLKSAVIHTHNHVVLLGTCRRTVHVYKRPYKKNGELKLYNARPDRIIDMSKYCEVGTLGGYMQQLDVVETLNGHRLLVLCSRKFFCIDLLHKSHKQLNETKKKAVHAIPLKHIYMTRSKAKCLRNKKKLRL